MLRCTTICFVVLTCSVCFGSKETLQNESDRGGRRGAVFKWAPVGQVEMLIDATQGGQMYCYTVEANTLEGLVTPEARLRIQFMFPLFENDQKNLDEFVVSSCKRDDWENLVKLSRNGWNQYTIYFKDTNGICYERKMEVSIIKDNESSEKRNVPEPLDCGRIGGDFRAACEGNVYPGSWMGNLEPFLGVRLEIKSKVHTNERFPDNFDGEDYYNFMACRTAKVGGNEFYIVEVTIRKFPIDRLYVNSCSSHSLGTSIVLRKAEIRTQPSTADEPVTPNTQTTEVVINYLDTKGKCKQREYKVTDLKIMRGKVTERHHVTVERFSLTDVRPKYCWFHKLGGFLRTFFRALSCANDTTK